MHYLPGFLIYTKVLEIKKSKILPIDSLAPNTISVCKSIIGGIWGNLIHQGCTMYIIISIFVCIVLPLTSKMMPPISTSIANLRLANAHNRDVVTGVAQGHLPPPHIFSNQ